MSKKVEKRTCRLCHEVKTIDKFEKDKRVKTGYTTRCKACKAGLNDKARTLHSRLKGRAKADKQPLEVTLKELRGLFAAFDGKCVYCNATEDETGRPHHVDHVIAVSKGGRHHLSNLVVACDPCNRSKGNRPFFEFYKAKKDEIGDDNFTALLYYISFTSGQPLEDIFKSFLIEYIDKNYGIMREILGDEFEEEVNKEVKKKIITERAG